MEEDFYEELPADQGEELYEDLPESAYSQQDFGYPNGGFNQGYQQQNSGAPPPLPTSSIPTLRPGGGLTSPPPVPAPTPAPPPAAAPPLPSRSANTQLTSVKAPPHGKKTTKDKDPKRKTAPAKPPAKGGGAPGLNMTEILQRAKARQPIGDLEKKFKEDTGDEGKHVAPWANQLRKTPKHEPRPLTPEEQQQKEEVPEFIRKARTLSVAESDEGDDTHPQLPPKVNQSPSIARKPAPGPPPGAKPRVLNPAAMLPKSVEHDSSREKPGWLKQRERQVAQAQQDGNLPGTENKPSTPATEGKARTSPKPVRPAPTKPPGVAGKPSPPLAAKSVAGGKPNVAGKPSPPLVGKPSPPLVGKPSPPLVGKPSPPLVGKPVPSPPSTRVVNGEVTPQVPQVTKKPRPTPTPRNAVTSPEKKPPSVQPSSSIRERAATLQMRISSGESPVQPDAEETTPFPVPVTSKPPGGARVPPPKPIRLSSASSEPEPPLPPPPTTQPPLSAGVKPPPPLPTRNSSAPPPPPETPPPPSDSKPPPPLPPTTSPPTFNSTFQLPPLPGKPPAGKPMVKLPPPPPTTSGQPTPPTGSVMTFRRLPLRPVDLAHPPPLPSRDAKVMKNVAAWGPAEPITELQVEEDEELYEDTILPSIVSNDFEEQLYDDVASAVAPPPIARPPPVSSYNKLPGETPPPIPTLPPPNKKSGSISDISQVNGTGTPEIIPEDGELYEDLATFPSSGSPLPPLPPSASSNSLNLQPPSNLSSSSSLAPPSPQHVGGSANSSPTLSRKKLSKDEKRKLKEMEKLEREQKRKNELRMKNKQKGLKAHKQFNLPADVKHLFAVEVLLEHPKPTKDHVACYAGDILFVLLIAHEKMSGEKYLVEKEDGTIGFVKKINTQRTNYTDPQSILSQPTPPIPEASQGGGAYPEPEDIYESLPQDDEPFTSSVAPPLPTQAIPTLSRVVTTGPPRFPAPNAPPPPPPQDGPEELYEYLPEED